MNFNLYNSHNWEPCRRKEESVSSSIVCNIYDVLPSRHGRKPDWTELRQLFCDGVIVSDDGDRIPVHRALLAATSSYFRAAFSSPLGSDTVHLKCCTDTVNSILDFIYDGKCQLTEDSAKVILIVADMYGLLDLADYCSIALLELLKPENCVEIHRLGKFLSYQGLQNGSLNYILRNFEEVLKVSTELYNLDAEELGEYLKNDLLNIRSEFIIDELVNKWVSMDPESRSASKELLLRHQRGNYLVTAFKDDPVWSRVPHQIIITVGGFEDEQTVTGVMETYDPRAQCWLEWGLNTREYRGYHGMVIVDGFIYIVGGYDGHIFQNTVRKFDPVQRYWTDLSHMVMPRCFVSVVVLDGYIYALGGRASETMRLESCERYNINLNQWQLIPAMHYQRSDAAAAVLNGKIYIVGGYTGDYSLNSVEVYDPKTMIWQFFVNLPTPLSGLQLIAHNDRLFVLGGFDGDIRVSSVHSIAENGSYWKEEEGMLIARSNFAVVSFEDRIWVIGGYGEGIGTMNGTESFGPDGWRREQFLCRERSCLGAVVLTNIANPAVYSAKYWYEKFAYSAISDTSYEAEQLDSF